VTALRRSLRTWVWAASLAAAWPAHAQGAASAAAGGHPNDVRSWMVRVQRAAATLNYQGTLVSSAAGLVSSSRVAHYCEGKQRYERIDVLDGETRQVLRHNDVTQTVWPRARVAVIEQRLAMPDFPGLPPADARSGEVYELRLLGTERVAGHEAQVLMFKPRDAHRFAQRLWAERASGLLLRADVLGARGDAERGQLAGIAPVAEVPGDRQLERALPVGRRLALPQPAGAQFLTGGHDLRRRHPRGARGAGQGDSDRRAPPRGRARRPRRHRG